MTFIQDFCDLVRFLYFKTEKFPNLKTEVDSYMKVLFNDKFYFKIAFKYFYGNCIYIWLKTEEILFCFFDEKKNFGLFFRPNSFESV